MFHIDFNGACILGEICAMYTPISDPPALLIGLETGEILLAENLSMGENLPRAKCVEGNFEQVPVPDVNLHMINLGDVVVSQSPASTELIQCSITPIMAYGTVFSIPVGFGPRSRQWRVFKNVSPEAIISEEEQEKDGDNSDCS